MPVPIDRFPDVPLLNYSDARSQIRSGDILMCSGSSAFSTLIQAATGSIWSHIAFIMRVDEIDRIMVFESVESIGVRIVPLSFYLNNYAGEGKPYPGKMLIARHKDFKESHIKQLSKSAIDLVGSKYDSAEIIKIAARIGFSRFSDGKECKIPEEGKEYICSEYAYQLYNSLGIYIEHDCRGFVAPADFAKTEEVNSIFSLI